jgi:hypothetical protein
MFFSGGIMYRAMLATSVNGLAWQETTSSLFLSGMDRPARLVVSWRLQIDVIELVGHGTRNVT